MKKPDHTSRFSFAAHGVFSEKTFWRRAFTLYVALEAVYWVIHYFTLKNTCLQCLQPEWFYGGMWLLHVLFTGLLWFVLHFVSRQRLAVKILVNIAVFAAHYFLWLFVIYQIHQSAPGWMVGRRYVFYFTDLVFESWFDIGKYVLKLTAFYVLKFYADYRVAADRRLQLAVINKDLQLHLLKQQLSPHFYFNTINNLYGLARSNSAKLPTALQQLQNIMHYVLVDCNEPNVTLQKEVEFLQSYIALEKLRYEKNTSIDMRVEGRANGHTIIPMLLIQFVENAFKHGMKEKSEDNWMQVHLLIEKEHLVFTVANSHYTPAAREGIGLASVQQRLDLQYEGRYHLQFAPGAERYSVTLKLTLS